MQSNAAINATNAKVKVEAYLGETFSVIFCNISTENNLKGKSRNITYLTFFVRKLKRKNVTNKMVKK